MAPKVPSHSSRVAATPESARRPPRPLAASIASAAIAATGIALLALQAGALHLALARRERPRSLLAGFCLAVAAMTRYTAVALLPALLLAGALAAPVPGRSRAREALLLLAGFVAAVLPFVALSLG